MIKQNGIAIHTAPSSGEKVLWIHGYTINASLWSDLWALLPEWHHIGIDLPGHGLSDGWPENPTLPTLARAIGEIGIEHGAQHIVGLSFGSAIALQVVIEFGNTFSSLTLGAPALGNGPLHPPIANRYRQLMLLHSLRGVGPWMTKLWMKSPSDIFDSVPTESRLRQQLIEVIDTHNWQELISGAIRRLPFYPQTPAMLAAINVPTFVMVGEYEMPAFKQTANILTTHIPNSRCVTLPDTGHLCMLEHPDICSRLMADNFRRWSVGKQATMQETTHRYAAMANQ